MVELQGNTLVICGLNDTFLIKICAGYVEVALLCTTAIADGVVLRGSKLIKFAHPIRTIAQSGRVGKRRVLRLTGSSHHLIVQRGKLIGLEQW